MSYKYKMIFKQTSASTYRTWGVFNQSSYQGRNMSLTYVSGTPGAWAIR